MRILSPFHDYYDAVQRDFQDDGLLYVRKTETEWIERKKFTLPLTYSPKFGGLDVVGFCGKIYPVFTKVEVVIGSLQKKIWAFDSDSAIEIIKDYCTKKKIKQPNTFDINTLKEFFEEVRVSEDKFADLFTDKKCPIFSYAPTKQDAIEFQWNCRLSKYGFHKKFPPYLAYQELLMWFANLAQPNKPIPKIPDKILSEAKGFDKYSFRKEPSKKRK